MTPEELAAEREAWKERQAKRRAEEPTRAPRRPKKAFDEGFYVMTSEDRAKIREHEYVPPPPIADVR